jgi:hypothetical protein
MALNYSSMNVSFLFAPGCPVDLDFTCAVTGGAWWLAKGRYKHAISVLCRVAVTWNSRKRKRGIPRLNPAGFMVVHNCPATFLHCSFKPRQ